MKLTDRLVGDHLTFRKMIQQIDAIADAAPGLRDGRKLLRLAELFKDHLILHAWVEDVFYYPAIKQALPRALAPVSAAYMAHLDDEHRTIDGYLGRLEDEVRAGVGTWPQTYALFSKGLLAHMKKEEEELFPASEKMLGAEALEELSRELERRRAEAPAVRQHTRLD